MALVSDSMSELGKKEMHIDSFNSYFHLRPLALRPKKVVEPLDKENRSPPAQSDDQAMWWVWRTEKANSSKSFFLILGRKDMFFDFCRKIKRTGREDFGLSHLSH